MIKAVIIILAIASIANAGAPITYTGGYATGGYATGAYATGGYSTAAIAPAVQYASAPVAVQAAPVAVAKAVTVREEPYDPHPQYKYGYSVSDAVTGDQKSASESRDGDFVQGQYSLVEPDGTIRTVTYTSDGINGFNAVVNRQAPAVRYSTVPVVQYARPAVRVATPAISTASYGHGGYY